ncbi:hypothetical protein ACFFRR_006593 [Megaselia abdita]
MQFTSLDGDRLFLEVKNHNPGSVEIILRNEDFPKKFKDSLKLIFTVFLCGILGHLINVYLLVLIILGILETLLIYKCLALFKEQQIIFISCIGFQVSSKKTIGTTTKYIPIKEFHDIVINEVIYNFNIKSVLLLRTKTKQKPLVPLLEPLNPPLSCLEEVFKVINKIVKLP